MAKYNLIKYEENWNAGWGKVGYSVHKENTVINKNTRINYVSCTHNCKPTLAPPYI